MINCKQSAQGFWRGCLAAWLLPCVLALLGAGCASPGGGGGRAGAAHVDLTREPWFPPVTAQQGFSCSQQAGLYYAFTAEWNRREGRDAQSPARRFSPYFAYSLLAGEDSGRSHVVDGWITGQQLGVPLEVDSPRYTNAVMHGYPRYLRAMQHRVKRWEVLPVTTAADVARVEQLLAGGHPLVCDFQIKGAVLQPQPPASVQNPVRDNIESGSGGSVKYAPLPAPSVFVRQWGRSGPGHAMIYAGYNRRFGYDANGDGVITTDRDITGDGPVTLADCERGAFLVVNPWGGSWGDRGRAWVPVRLHAVSAWPWSRSVARVEPAERAHPRLVLKLSLRAGDRQNLLVTVSDDRGHSVQPFMFSHAPVAGGGGSMWEAFTSLRQPGPHLTRGALGGPGGGPLESGHDISALPAGGRYTVSIRPAGRGALSGLIAAASVMEYDASGRLTGERRVSGLPGPLPVAGGEWTTEP